ncbi:MAG: GyrI-like domain-containing protein [Flavobacteriaceae bacterium]|nr:MAG: GyrI-like domain-containing protein [Flavobacteriaceae bacterium]
MILTPSIVHLEPKILIGRAVKTNLIQNKTATLWRGFMGSRHQITKVINEDLFSIQVYPKNYFDSFSPATYFIKWAAKEVSSMENIPDEMQSISLKGGMYAVFDYKGSSEDHTIYEVIFTEWLPNSDYILDDRPHFEILGEKYKNRDENSEEQLWIPIKIK